MAKKVLNRKRNGALNYSLRMSITCAASLQGKSLVGASESTPLKSTDKTDKSLTQEEAEAVGLLNLSGVRIMRHGRDFIVGVWEDLDSPELRAAIRTVGMGDLRVVHLEGAEVPIRFKVRSCPDRALGESFERWHARALAEARRRWHWTAQLHPSPSSQTT